MAEPQDWWLTRCLVSSGIRQEPCGGTRIGASAVAGTGPRSREVPKPAVSELPDHLGSPAWRDPGLAAEWSPTNPVTAWRVRPHTSTAFSPEWICATGPAHVWRSPLSSRSGGAECPQCREHGKSRVELDHWEAAKEVFGHATSGLVVRDRGRSQYPDRVRRRVLAPVAKLLIDERKSNDLLAAGYVVRAATRPPRCGQARSYAARLWAVGRRWRGLCFRGFGAQSPGLALGPKSWSPSTAGVPGVGSRRCARATR